MNQERSDQQEEGALRALGYRQTPQRLLILSVLQRPGRASLSGRSWNACMSISGR